MQAAYILETGGPEVIRFGDIPQPSLGPGQVRVAVKWVAVNPIDTYIRGGANFWPLPQPFIIGCDMAGEVLEMATNVAAVPGGQSLEIGQHVWCTNQGLLQRQGTFAQQVVVDAQWLYPLASHVPCDVAASMALVGVTAHLGLFREANLQAGQTVCVIGGTGGVGSLVVQLAKLAGARVIATGSSDQKVARCIELGADVAINYRQHDLQQAILEHTAGQGVNVFWETRREPDFDLAIAVLAERGKMIVMAGRDARPSFPVGPFYVKGCQVHGFVMFKATPAEMQVAGLAISQALANGQLQAQIGARFPLSEAAAAHRLQEANTLQHADTLTGKIVLEV